MRFSARIFAVIVGLIFFINLLPVSAFAADSTAPVAMPQTDQGVPKDVHTLTQSIILGMVSFVTCAISGVDMTYSNHKCLGYNPQTGKLGYVSNPTSITSLLTSGIALTYQKPMTTTDYVHYLSGNFGLVKQTYAADGFTQLSPLLSIWVVMRNVSYILFVVIFVGTGFAIMIRAKIDPRTAMTIENQIPKLIIALLLISFSFAIAGLVIDITWVALFIIINLFASHGIDPQLAGQIGSITSGAVDSPLSLANSVSGAGGFLGIAAQAAGGIKDISNTVAQAFFGTAVGTVIKWILVPFEGIPILISCIISQFVSNVPIIGWFTGSKDFGTCFNNGMATIISGFGAVIAFLVFAIAMIIALVKLWWQLIKAYSLLIIYVIFAPLMIMAGVLPGSKINFENWLRHVVAYAIVPCVAAAILLTGKVVMDAYSNNHGYVPPLLGIPPSASQALGPLLGFAIIMLLPQSLTIVQDALQAPDMKYLPGIGAMLAAGTTATTTLINKPWQRLTRKESKMEGLSEGALRKLVLGGPGSLRRRFLGDTSKA